MIAPHLLLADMWVLRQGFADSSSDDDEDDRVADGTAIDGDNQALPSHSAERDQPRDAFDEAAAKEEKKKSMQLLSSMFGGPSDTGRTAQDTSEVEQHEGADEGARADPMYWHQTKRYDPTAADAAMLEMNPVPLEAAAGQAVPTPMPMVPSTKAYDMGTSRSIASLCAHQRHFFAPLHMPPLPVKVEGRATPQQQ